MEKKKTIIYSMILATIVLGAILSLTYFGRNNGNFKPLPTNDNEMVFSSNNASQYNDNFRVLPEADPPTISDTSLKVEMVIEGLDLPTSMTFLGLDDILILQKDNGNVRLVSQGVLQPNPILEVFVVNNSERGLLGVALANGTSDMKLVFLYYTEQVGNEIRNRIYRYELDVNNNLGGRSLVVDLPGQPGPNHDGGKMTIGPDGMLYAVIGDLNRKGMLQNYVTGPAPDDTSVILRVDQDGSAVNGVLGSDLDKYHAYGIRNSFGMDFDPVTAKLWITENGPESYDEINVVEPGFNSGWAQIMGPIDRSGGTFDNLKQLEGSHYADPVFSWRQPQGITDIEFLTSTKLGDKYARNIFVGDFNNGNLYFFILNSNRMGLELDNDGLEDLVADNNGEVETITFGTGFSGITDIETGPDGYLYILTFGGKIYRIVPAS